MEEFVDDVRSAYRSLVRHPGFALLVVATLGLGLGTGAAMFSVVDGVLLEPLPFDDPERLVTVVRQFSDDPERDAGSLSLPDLKDLNRESTTLDALVGTSQSRLTLVNGGNAELLSSLEVTGGLLEVFGLTPQLGRDLRAEEGEIGAPRTAVIAHAFWLSRFAGDPSVLGRTLQLSGEAYEIVGVAPEGFDYPEGTEIWVPGQVDEEDCGRGCHVLGAVARLAPGIDAEEASRELEVLGAALEARYPETNTHKRFVAQGLGERSVAPVRFALWMLMGAVLLVVLIAAANVANLVMVRGSRRRRELAIRTAVGAGQARLFRQLMLENVLLAVAGGILGLGVGQGLLSLFLRIAPPRLPRLEEVRLDGEVFLFTGLMCGAVLMIFGLLPTLRFSGAGLRSRANAGTLEETRSRGLFLAGEVALTLLLLLGAGLLLRSFVQLTEAELGFVPERVTRFSFNLPESAYEEAEKVLGLSRQLEERLRRSPGVEAAALAFSGPFSTRRITSTFEPLDRPSAAPGKELVASLDVVSPGYFEALGIPLVQGRGFTDRDTRDAPLALVISRNLAERYFPGKDPLGQRAKVGISFYYDDEDTPYTIVGVVEDVRAYSLTDDPQPAVYLVQAQTASPYLVGFVRASEGLDIGSLVRREMRALDPMLPVRSVKTQEEAVWEAFGPRRFYLALLGGFAGLGLLLSAVGLYGVVSYLVVQRTRELAVRMALGADRSRVLQLVLVDGLRPAAVGIGAGLLGGLLGARLLEGLLYGVTAYDTVTFVFAPLVLILFAALATAVPALRASRLDPRLALEEE